VSNVLEIQVSKLSKALIVLAVTDAGVLFGGSYQVSIAPEGTDPTVWQSPDSANGQTGIMIGPGSAVGALTAGWYRTWAKATANPELPVFKSPQQVHVV
jgi:hypothetical protein